MKKTTQTCKRNRFGYHFWALAALLLFNAQQLVAQTSEYEKLDEWVAKDKIDIFIDALKKEPTSVQSLSRAAESQTKKVLKNGKVAIKNTNT